MFTHLYFLLSRHVHRDETMNKYYFSCQRERFYRYYAIGWRAPSFSANSLSDQSLAHDLPRSRFFSCSAPRLKSRVEIYFLSLHPSQEGATGKTAPTITHVLILSRMIARRS